MKNMFDVIVIGVGSMGSSTLSALAKRGANVLGIEQFGLSHEKGSHSGQTRIVRKAYFEHENYVPLLKSAYKGWDEIAEEVEKKLFHEVGLEYYGEREHEVIDGVVNSANKYSIPIDLQSSNSCHPNFKLPKEFVSLTEPEAGFVMADETIKAYGEVAKKHGAILKTNEKVLNWEVKNERVEVRTNENIYYAEKLIITAGAYIKELIPQHSEVLKVTRQLLAWIKPKDPTQFKLGNFPCWVIADKGFPGIFYGFPILPLDKFGGTGLLKVAHHYHGEEIDTPMLFGFSEKDEVEKLTSIINTYIPEALGEMISVTPCMYTCTQDDHFVIDHLPEYDQRVTISTGFSGHGFKFVSVVGEILSDLALEGETDHPIDFLNMNRFA
ncbi:MAG: N-methyl-L-tryptophan oxidase [Balneola sp.]